jgi:hypothetical protein
MREYLFEKRMNIAYIEVLFTNFQDILTQIPHNSEIVYKSPRQRGGSPAMRPLSVIRRNNIMSNTTIHKEFINDKARRQLFRPYRPSSGLKYKNAEGLSAFLYL